MRIIAIVLLLSLNGCSLLMHMTMQPAAKMDIRCQGRVERVTLEFGGGLRTGSRIPAVVFHPDEVCRRVAHWQDAIDQPLLMIDTRDNPSADELLAAAGKDVIVRGRVRRWSGPAVHYSVPSGAIAQMDPPTTRPVAYRIEVKSIDEAGADGARQ